MRKLNQAITERDLEQMSTTESTLELQRFMSKWLSKGACPHDVKFPFNDILVVGHTIVVQNERLHASSGSPRTIRDNPEPSTLCGLSFEA